jgi:hypothetical protein
MKRTFLIIVAVLLITANGNCQWYQRKYGVNDINQLSQQQINESLRKAKVRAWTGAYISCIGVITLSSGISMKYAPKDLHGSQLQEQQISKVAFLTLGSVLTPVGLTMLFKNCSRMKAIKKTMKNTEISLGVTNCPTDNMFNSSNIYAIPTISVAINF